MAIRFRKKLREDKTCQNCGCHVEKRYCPCCGQENTETRVRFYRIFSYFFSTMFNYESNAWNTAKAMFTRPGKLSTEYLEGKRNSYVKPLTLYIFCNFVAFLSIAFVPSSGIKDFVSEQMGKIMHFDDAGSIKGFVKGNKIELDENLSGEEVYTPDDIIKIIKEHDKIQRQIDKFAWALETYMPKLLLITLPIAAFWAWLINIRRRKYYFDSFIFTIHIYSLQLLLMTLFFLSLQVASWVGIGNEGLESMMTKGYLFFILAAFIYQYIAYKRFYNIRWVRSIFSYLGYSFLLLLSTAIILGCYLLVLGVYSFGMWKS